MAATHPDYTSNQQDFTHCLQDPIPRKIKEHALYSAIVAWEDMSIKANNIPQII